MISILIADQNCRVLPLHKRCKVDKNLVILPLGIVDLHAIVDDLLILLILTLRCCLR